mgnify:CR=1 FL=1
MTNKFVVQDGASPDEAFFDRQKLISWWDQKIIANAKLMVVGAGALGNETIKNLLLLGFRKILICDFDEIETSNLSRTVLFGPQDVGKSKAHTAAERARSLCLSKEHCIRSFHGDITSELGFGIFKEMDLVFGCVDNVEARRFINRACRLVGTPWIDSGINELAGHVSLYSPADPVCYECVLTLHQLEMARQRYSCDQVKRSFVQQARIPTVQVTSSIISGIQVQEGVKLLCGATAISGQRIWFEGARNQFELFNLAPHPNCEMHASFGDIVDVDLSSQLTVQQALNDLESAGFGPNPVLVDTLGVRQFVETAACRKCGKSISLYRPLHALSENDLICDSPHDDSSASQDHAEPGQAVEKKVTNSYSMTTTSPTVLAMTLSEVGIPPGDIVGVQFSDGQPRYIRLAKDIPLHALT